MKWPETNQLFEMAPLPGGFRYDWVKRSEIPNLIACIDRWDPDIAMGSSNYSPEILG